MNVSTGSKSDTHRAAGKMDYSRIMVRFLFIRSPFQYRLELNYMLNIITYRRLQYENDISALLIGIRKIRSFYNFNQVYKHVCKCHRKTLGETYLKTNMIILKQLK